MEVVKENSHALTPEPVLPELEMRIPENKPEIHADIPALPIDKPDTKLKSDVKPMKLVKTGDQSEERSILLGGLLLLFGAVLLWYRKSVR
ncbi:LPXTG cell wall anchor domain-containing protein [Listeria cornellensis]|uniref:Gram-positive cocci surface proteins LPxTG domain-containing protein n=1 Tax=Listeria cornellensis FSL F6-0969 TaxID=1265820 RepID=W7C784_9LIST|nr:LPXTG cell wall anchor domain-containing protein [Listeria cornellensis]EUJ32882.1 hypothetical protein PCORN_00295 [Listeria cornellensis FSL F6-0969]